MWLKIENGDEKGTTLQVEDRQFVVGRDEECDLVLDDERVSRRHARFESLDSGGMVVRDLGSTNGTFVDGRRIGDPVVLEGGEHVKVGKTELLVTRNEPVPFTTIERSAMVATAEAPPRVVAPPTPSAVERSHLRRVTKRSTRIAAASAAVVVVLVIALIAGVFGSGGGDDTPAASDVIAGARPSVVQVSQLNPRADLAGWGSGWVLDAEEGLIVTNHHVVNGGTTYTVTVGDAVRDAKIVGAAPCSDLAVLQIDNTRGLRNLPMSSQSALREGDPVIALGYPGNAAARPDFQATTGVVSAVHTTFDIRNVAGPRQLATIAPADNVVQTDTAINHGNSGGPLVDSHGRLVGVNTFGLTEAGKDNENFAIGVDKVKSIVPQLRKRLSPSWLGLTFDFGTDPAEFGLPQTAGLLTLGGIPGTPAAASVFGKVPALIVSINGAPVQDLADYCGATAGLKSGDFVKVQAYLPPGTDEANPTAVVNYEAQLKLA